MTHKIISEQDLMNALPAIARMIPDEIWKDFFNSLPSAQGEEYDEYAAKRLRAILSMLGIAAPESDEQMMLCQFSLFGMMRRKISDLYKSPQLPPDAAARIAEPDWSMSETHEAEAWKDPSKPMAERLIIADHAVWFRSQTAAARIAELEAENKRLNEEIESYSFRYHAQKDDKFFVMKQRENLADALNKMIVLCEVANERCLNQIGIGPIDLIGISNAKQTIIDVKEGKVD